MPMLGIQRASPEMLNVPCWESFGVPLGLRISYQRTADAVLPPLTECTATSASWSPKFR